MRTPHKIAAALLVLAVASAHLLNSGYRDWNAGPDMIYVMALIALFFSREPVEDERVQVLKLKALGVAFFNAWAFTGAVRFVAYLQDRSVPPRTMSAYDVMFVTLLVALALFHYWRWQDGRGASRS